ncbi:MAG TPA: hypothetical protein VGP63_10450 [Planctomycetaceae bacterium]|jgi:hypothetical protein|nr:hypothetical protein [Planctomycetaceae bacterium]
MQSQLQTAVAQVGAALREPEEFALRWDRGTARHGPWVWAALLATAIFGTTTYGMTMGLLGGVQDVLQKACSARWPGSESW